MIITVIHIDKRWQSQETLTEDNKSKETLVEIEIIAKVDKSKETLVETETTIKVFSNSVWIFDVDVNLETVSFTKKTNSVF